MMTEFQTRVHLKSYALWGGRSLVWVFDQLWAVSDRAYAIVFAGVLIALSSAVFLMAVATGIPEFQAISGMAAALTIYVCLEQIYDRHTYFVFVGCMFISSIGAVTAAAISARLPTHLLLPVALGSLIPHLIAFLLMMHLGESFVKWFVRFITLGPKAQDEPQEEN